MPADVSPEVLQFQVPLIHVNDSCDNPQLPTSAGSKAFQYFHFLLRSELKLLLLQSRDHVIDAWHVRLHGDQRDQELGALSALPTIGGNA